MEIRLHANARTTPSTRAEIASSSQSVSQLAAFYGVSETTIRRWRKRAGEVQDRSSRPRDLAVSTSDLEEAIICELRRDLRLPLDDIVHVMKSCVNAALSRSAIHRCLQRHGLSAPLKEPEPVSKAAPFADEPCGFIHMDLKHLPTLQNQRSYVFVAIDRATRYVYIEVHADRTAATAVGFLDRFVEHFPQTVRTVLTDNGSEFTDRFSDATKDKEPGRPSGRHPFDVACAARGIKHKLTKPFSPKTNGMVERFNRRIGQALAAVKNVHSRRKFHTADERRTFLEAFVNDYNRTRLRCLDYKAPLEVLNNLPGHNTQADHPRFYRARVFGAAVGWIPAFAGMTIRVRRTAPSPAPAGSPPSAGPWPRSETESASPPRAEIRSVRL